ncbi:MAG TPA: YbdD/YjiX family protein [Pseudonocardia sp.]|nr:YbdD/YjiX family protein [Pseudonocardia sp.]
MRSSRACLRDVAAALGTGARGVLWYLRELTGENGYSHYLDHQRRVHPGRPVMTRREFEHHRVERSAQPGARCC